MSGCSENQKHEAFLQYLCGYTPKEIAAGVGIHFTSVYRWIDGWKKGLEGLSLTELPIQDMGIVLTRIEELQKQLNEQECMIAIIHESRVLQNIPLKRRTDIAMKYLDTYSVTQLCHIFEIKPSTLYYHIRIAKNGTRRQQQENLLCSEIKRIFDESGRRLGAEQIRLRLKNKVSILARKGSSD